MSPQLNHFLGGVIAMGYVMIAGFFLKFHLRTREALFVAFSAAFLLLAILSTLVAVLNIPQEEQSPFFLLKPAAFLLIIAAIILKNLKPNRD